MRRSLTLAALTIGLALATVPLMAQTLPGDPPASDPLPDDPVPRDPLPRDPLAEEEPGVLERGAEQMLRELLDEIGPALDEAERAFREMEPKLRAMLPVMRELAEMIGDIDEYHLPEKLPNGDILLRRRLPGEREPERIPDPAPDRPSPQPGLPGPAPGEEIEI